MRESCRKTVQRNLSSSHSYIELTPCFSSIFPVFLPFINNSEKQIVLNHPSLMLHCPFPSYHRTSTFPSLLSTRSTGHGCTFHLFAAPHNLNAATDLQLQQFRQTVLTSSDKLQALEDFHRNGGIQTASDLNNILKSLISADEFDFALKLKSSLSLFPADDWTYSIWVTCHCKRNEPTEAKTVLEQMLEKGFRPDVATFTTLINSFCKIGKMSDAFEVFDVMSRIGCEPTINTYNCLLKGLCYVGRVEEAHELMESIKTNPSIKPDIYTYTAVMDGFCKVGRSVEATELLREALEMKLSPNVVTYNTLFNSYFKEGKPLRGFALLKQMKERNCKPDYICYITFLHGLLKWGKTTAALQIFKEMVEAGFPVDERMMNTLLRGLCRRLRKEEGLRKDVYEVFAKMRDSSNKYAICPRAYDLVIEALCSGKEVDGSRISDVMNEMVSLGHSPRTFTFSTAIRALCSVGEVDKALCVFTWMPKERKLDRIPFSLLIDKLNQQQRWVEASSVYALALKRGMVPKRKPGCKGGPMP